MRDGDDGARIFVQEVFQPGDRLGVEVVGRFVEQQHIRLRQQQPAQRHAALLAARQRADLRIPRRQPQRVRGDLELALQFPAADRVDPVLQLRLVVHQLRHRVVGQGLGEAVADRIKPVEQVLDVADPLADDLAHGLRLVQLRFLRQVADLDAGLGAGFALDLPVNAGHDPEQARFSGAVEAQDADLGPGEEAQADVAQDDAPGGHDLADPVHGVDELRHR